MKRILMVLLGCMFSVMLLAQESALSRNSNIRSGPSSSTQTRNKINASQLRV